MQIEIKKLQRLTGVTTVMVTHDQEEALAMADRVAVMSRGRIEHFGTPTEVYDRPATLFASRFVGTTNLFPGTVVRLSAKEAEIKLDCGPTIIATSVDLLPATRRSLVSIRPEHFRMEPHAGDGAIATTVRVVMPLGPTVFYELETDDGLGIKLTQPREERNVSPALGTRVFLKPATSSACRAYKEPSE